MKNRLKLLGIASPVLLIGICAVAGLSMGTVGWLFFGSGDGDIVKVATVGPIFQLKAVENSDVSAPAIVGETGQNITEPSSGTPSAAQAVADVSANLEADVPSLTSEEIEERLGFALPTDSVNSINQDGLANRLVIPKMELDAPIVIAPIKNQTWQVDHLEQSVGHLEGTARPGSNSNLVLAAHVTLETGEYGPFAGLGNLSPGDTVFVYDGDQKKYEYVIDSHDTVDRTAVEVTFPTDSGQLTLITCNNWNDEEGRYMERLVIKGHLLN